MTERTYEHTFDMDLLAELAARYEATSAKGQEAADDQDYSTAVDHAIEALVLAQQMFYLVLPQDVREEFWDALEKVLNPEEVEA